MLNQKFSLSAGSTKFNHERRLMLFDLSIYGHHSSYIRHLIKYWSEKELPGSLDIVVSPQFMQEHSDVANLPAEYNLKNVNFVAVDPAQEAALKSRKTGLSRTVRAFQEWEIFCKYARHLKSTQALLLYFDTCLLPLAFGRNAPCAFSGIYFRPTFHYSDFTNYLPSRKDRIQQQREKYILSRVLHNSQLQTLFCLDPFVVKHFNKFRTKVEAVHLPDPVQIHHESVQSNSLKEKLGIQSDKQVLLLFGALDGRKGIHQLLEAVTLLPPELLKKLCLVFIGESHPVERALIETQVLAVCQSHPIQIVRHYEFVPEQDVAAYFQLADVVLAPYQRHVGMSGILLLAAAAQKPVLSSNYGLMGEIVQKYSLGITIDSTLPSGIANGLTQFLLASPDRLCDHSKMKLFSEQNSAERFAETIFQCLLAQ